MTFKHLIESYTDKKLTSSQKKTISVYGTVVRPLCKDTVCEALIKD